MARYELEDHQWDLIKGLMPRRSSRRQMERAPNHAERNPLGSQIRSAVARPARAVRQVEIGPRPTVSLAEQRHLRSDSHGPARAFGQTRQDRLGSVAGRWIECPSVTRRRGGTQKKGRSDAFEPDDHALGRSRGGWGSKFHLVTDGNGLPLAIRLTAGQTHESTQFPALMCSVPRPRRIGWPAKVAGDKGYSYQAIRDFLGGRGIEAVIPRRSNQTTPEGETFDKTTYRKRSRIECAVGWLKECRRLGTRYEKLAGNFIAFAKLAFMLKYLRILDPSDRA